MKLIDLNIDVGEQAGFDGVLIPLATSVSIACGGHAGDDESMQAAVQAAVENHVAIGAHPGHTDRKTFGRVEHPLTADQAEELVSGQLARLTTIVHQQGGVVRYVKLHGALYHQANRDPEVARGAVAGVTKAAGHLALLGQPGGALEARAKEARVRFFHEAFADRAYLRGGLLAPRGAPGALRDDPGLAASQAVAITLHGRVDCLDGAQHPLRCDSLCLHGDTPHAPRVARAVRDALLAAGIQLRAFCDAGA